MVTVQGQQHAAILGGSGRNSSVFQSEGGIGDGEVLEHSLIPTKKRMCLSIEDVPLWSDRQSELNGRSL